MHFSILKTSAWWVCGVALQAGKKRRHATCVHMLRFLRRTFSFKTDIRVGQTSFFCCEDDFGEPRSHLVSSFCPEKRALTAERAPLQPKHEGSKV